MIRVTASEPQIAGIKPEADTLYPTVYPSGERKKAHAGTVKGEVFKERLRLRWRNLNHDCSAVWIGESFSNGVFKSTKTNRDRDVDLTPKLRDYLQRLKTEKRPVPDALVFPTPQGHPLDIHNFRNRAWKTILSRLEIDYRKPYKTRHSVISHALELGMNPVTVAGLTGHDVETLYRSYAGNVNSRPKLPEL
jgi:integrase